MAESVYILGDEDRRKFARLIAAAWEDGDLRARYGSGPRSLLSQYGIAYPDGVPTPLPPPRPQGEFDVTDLEVAAGSTGGTVSSISSIGSCYSTLCDVSACTGDSLTETQ